MSAVRAPLRPVDGMEFTALIVAGIATDTPHPASSSGGTRCQ